MIYTKIMDIIVGWYNRIDGLFLRLLLLPVALLLVIVGNIIALGAVSIAYIFKTVKKIV